MAHEDPHQKPTILNSHNRMSINIERLPYIHFLEAYMEYEIHSSVPRTFGVYIAFPISLAFSSTARSDTNSGNSVLWWIFKWIDRTRLGMLDGWCFDGMCMHGQEDITKGCMSEFPLIQCCIQPAWAASCWVRMDGQIDGWLMQRGRMLMLGHRAHTYELHWPFCFLHCGVFCGWNVCSWFFRACIEFHNWCVPWLWTGTNRKLWIQSSLLGFPKACWATSARMHGVVYTSHRTATGACRPSMVYGRSLVRWGI